MGVKAPLGLHERGGILGVQGALRAVQQSSRPMVALVCKSGVASGSMNWRRNDRVEGHKSVTGSMGRLQNQPQEFGRKPRIDSRRNVPNIICNHSLVGSCHCHQQYCTYHPPTYTHTLTYDTFTLAAALEFPDFFASFLFNCYSLDMV
jgi:hypothetical protein